jgi:hypothetical protein
MRRLAVAAALLLRLAQPAVAAPDPSIDYSDEQRAWFRSLHPPDRPEPCCDLSDCRPKPARIVGAGYEVYVDNAFGWVKVPRRAILHGTPNPIGEPILCYQKAGVAPKGLDLIIYCFVPAGEG